MSTERIQAADLHAGDWVVNPVNNRHEWVANRGRLVNGEIRFLIGRGSATGGTEIFWRPDEEVTRLARWPEMPDKWTIK